MQFYCQNAIRPKKDTKLCFRVEKWSRSVSSIEAPSIYYLWWCCVVVSEVIVCACATGSCINGYDVTGNDVTGSREPEMKGRSFPAVFPELL